MLVRCNIPSELQRDLKKHFYNTLRKSYTQDGMIKRLILRWIEWLRCTVEAL